MAEERGPFFTDRPDRPSLDDTQPVRYIERGEDRRSPPSTWQDPKTWMTLFGLMLSACAILLTATLWIASKMLEEIKTVNSNITNLTLSTSNSFTAQGINIDNLKREQAEQRAYMRDQNAYNFNVNKAMTEMATTMRLRGLPTPNIPEPPKLGGQ